MPSQVFMIMYRLRACTRFHKGIKNISYHKRNLPVLHHICTNYQTGNFPPPFVPISRLFEEHLDRLAIIDQHGKYKYKDILHESVLLAEKISTTLDLKSSKKQKHISFLCQNNVSYVIAQLACWLTKSVAVPLCRTHPASHLEYYVQDSESALLISSSEFTDKIDYLVQKLNIPVIYQDYPRNVNSEFSVDIAKYLPKKGKSDLLVEYNNFQKKIALIIYTSGTTGSPKGVVLTHSNLHAQVAALHKAWNWASSDVILHALPLHHMHGIMNALLCPLHIGACCVMLPKFDPEEVWNQLVNPNPEHRINLFMAVPTMYAKLIEYYNNRFSGSNGYHNTKEFIKAACTQKIRLMVSGSSALPEPVMNQWKEITGHTLLERYGMSEIGMGLSNPLNGTRVPGSVGLPLPGVEVCVAQKNVYAPTGHDIVLQGDNSYIMVKPGQEKEIGELWIRGSNVFKEYWNKPDATEAAINKDGWFKTGDTAQFVNGSFKILGRSSVDIIKSGGYKISALDVERDLLGHPNIIDCAVVGLPDMTWGEKVAAVITLKGDAMLSLDELRNWCKDHMPLYQIPSVLKCVTEIPRNNIGKVNKKELISNIFHNSKKAHIN